MPYGTTDDYAEALEEIRQLRLHLDRLRQALKVALGGGETDPSPPSAAREAAAPVPVPMTAHELLLLFLRDAATYGGLTDETVCSFGWWKKAPGDEFPSFHARLKLTLGELRRIEGLIRADERRL